MSSPQATPESDQTGTAAGPSPARPRLTAWRWARRVLAVIAAVVAALIVSMFTIDLGHFPQLKRMAEERASAYMRRPLHIGRLSVLMTPGTFVLDDVVIEGRKPGDRPFFRAGRIYVHVPWWTLFQRQLNVEVRLTDWAMVVETARDGHNVPRLTPERSQSTGPRPFTTTVRYVYAQGGEFTYLDHVTPWSVVARNLSFDLVRSTALQQYVGRARFSQGDVTILNYRPMAADMTARFVLDGPRVQLQHIDLRTDGSQSHVNGEVHFGSRWPEQTYNVTSTLDFARMKDIFFAKEPWVLDGTGEFAGVFKLFKGGGRELAGQFSSELAVVNDLAFPDLHGSLIWTPQRFEVTHAESSLLGGDTRFGYSIAPLGRPGGSTATFSASYRSLDLAALDQLIDLKGLQLDGRMSGSLELQWPNGKFAAGRHGSGHTVIEPLGVTILASRELPAAPLPPRPEPTPFDPFRRVGPLVVGADLHYDFDPDGMTFREGWAATDRTYISFGGRMASTGPSSFPFHVTSHDWQESDRLLAAIMTAISGPSRAIEVGGRGTFDGRMTGRFSAPRIEGRFQGERMRAWGVTWGAASGDIVMEGGYVTLSNSEVIKDGGRIVPDGRYSLGIRRDDAEEIKAHVRLTNWPMVDLRHAFGLDDWPVDGIVGMADLTLSGKYRQMFGDGQLRIDKGMAWGERFETATADLALEGTGIRMNRVEMAKGGSGVVRGAAVIAWDGTYAFNADGRLPVESLDNFKLERAPFSGNLTFKATGASEFDNPTYTFSGFVPDLYVGDQGIGAVEGEIRIEGKRLLIERIVMRSGLMDVDGRGTIALNDRYDGNVHLVFTQTSIDPYLKFVMPELSPYTRAIVSGVLDVTGPLGEPAGLTVSTSIHDATLTLFDYELKNEGPLRLNYADRKFTLTELRLLGSDTRLALTGGGDVARREWGLAASGDASLAILKLFFPQNEASGAATLDATLRGSFDEPVLNGSATVVDGRFRPLASPHGLENLNGQIRFRAGEINVDNLTGRIANGDVDFSGRIALDGYRLSEYDLSATGRAMRVRYPRGFHSTVNMDLDLGGPINAPRLSGTIDVLRVSYIGLGGSEASLFGLAAVGGPDSPADTVPLPASTSTMPLALDIQVTVPQMTLLETDNSAARIDGNADLRVLGTFDRPIVTGMVELTGGEASAFGNRYFIREGTIEFDPSGRALFDVSAETRPRVSSQTFDVQLRLTGPLSQIDMTMTSDPWLPQTEIVSLLLGGIPSVGSAEQQALRSSQELQQRMVQTAGAVLLTSALSSRVGAVVERFSALDTVQITPLLSNTISSDSSVQQLNPTARVTLGKRISNRVFLTYSRTLAAREDEIILIEYEQSNRLSWVLSRNEDRTFALDFRIRFVF